MKEDAAKYQSAVQRDKDGNPVNSLVLDDCKYKDEQNMGIYLQGLARTTDTHGKYVRVGEVYGFPISIISERTVVDGREGIQNRFVVEGNYKYKFNNGFIAMSDTHAACMNFVNALEKIPGIIAQYEERTAKLKADVPVLEGIVAKTWGKEDELKALKSELAALDRKITAELAPNTMKKTARKSSGMSSHSNHSGSRTRHNPPAQRSRWWLNLFICMPHGVLSLDYDRWQSRQLLNWIQCCRFCFCTLLSKMGYKFQDYLILF